MAELFEMLSKKGVERPGDSDALMPQGCKRLTSITVGLYDFLKNDV